MMSLEQAYKDKIKELFAKIKSVPCFSILESDKINSIIGSLALRKKKKFDFIYRQDE